MTKSTLLTDGPSSDSSARARITAGKEMRVSKTTTSTLSTDPPR